MKLLSLAEGFLVLYASLMKGSSIGELLLAMASLHQGNLPALLLVVDSDSN
ncbi:MAG TPA: hypothetical protein VJ248_10865 [Candidatus Udaeobacter sp.]|nr:hypothetical protein [Candidatus Udaeobacter sp.]